VAGVPSLFPEPHPYPVEFLPPEDILPLPAAPLKERRGMNGLALCLAKCGKESFMRAVRRTAKLSPAARNRRFRVVRASLLSPATKRRGYRHSREAFIRDVMAPVMEQRFWPDPRCRAIVRALRELRPKRLLDIATGPGGLLCAALPRLRSTRGIGLELFHDKCRTVLAEADYFGFADRLDMVHGDARLMPFPDASFDCISGWTAAYHISRYEDALRECARVLRPGGHFVGTFHTVYPRHCPGDLTRTEEDEFVRCARLPRNVGEVCRILRQAGFVVARNVEVGNSRLIVAMKTP
jgi:SAM-dependent methyltransferase